MKKLMLRYKNLLLLSTCIIGNLHSVFWGQKNRVDLYLLIDFTRRVDIATLYAANCINFLILAYCLKKPKGIKEDTKSFLLIVTIVDLIHYFTIAKIYFGLTKIGVYLLLYIIIVKPLETWQKLKSFMNTLKNLC